MKKVFTIKESELKQLIKASIEDKVFHTFRDELHLIDEGLIKIYGKDFTKRHVMDKFYNCINNIGEKLKVTNGVKVYMLSVEINKKVTKEEINGIIECMKFCGLFSC